ncbi:MAG: sensor histidine kinase [Blastocatellia bacterium]
MKMRTTFLLAETKGQFLLVGVLLLLAPLLAALQYRWLGQLSESEQKQMTAGLRVAAARFGEDFDQEITAAYAAFLPDFVQPDASAAGRLASGYARWQTAARYPRLVKTVYQTEGQTEAGDARALTLARFNPATQQMEACAWPPEMAALQAKLTRQRDRFREFMLRPAGATPPQYDSLHRPMPLDAAIPAMVIPPPRLLKLRSGNKITMMAPISFLVVTLNRDCITQEILPALVKRHFGEGAQSDYLLAVSSAESRQIIFQSASQALTAANADLSAGLFRLRTSELRNRLQQRAQFKMLPPRLAAAGGARARPAEAVAFPPLMPVMGMLAASDEQNGLWQLHLRHQAGSLGTAVAQARRRNLFIGFGILLLLGVSVALLVRSARRARRLARQQMDFVAGISHELRTPIAVIDSAAYNLANGVTHSSEQTQHYGLLIRKQTRQLHGMIEQVLEFAGIQSGRQPYQLQPVELNQLLEEVVQASQPLLAERGFQLQLDIPAELPVVLADAAALRRALQNLLDNALKYSGETRWIGLQAEVDAGVQPPQVALTVWDRGLGIPASDLPHIFEPFYRGSAIKAAQIHGNGLGLSLVKNIVQAHGGAIAVQSRPGAGSAFTLRLPIHANEQLQPVTPPMMANEKLRGAPE